MGLRKKWKTASTILAMVMVAGLVTSCGQPILGKGNVAEDSVDSYVAVAPRVLQAGQSEPVSIRLLNGEKPATSLVQVALLKEGSRVVEASGTVNGFGEVSLDVPRSAEGEYILQVAGKGFEAQQKVTVEDGTIVFAETDKPIYKPGQTVHIRVLTLDAQLRPLSAPITVEISDAKAIKVFKKELTTDDYGMAQFDLPLSTEPNLGVWKLVVRSGKRDAQVDIRVEKYVLPKYEIKVDTAKDWVLANEPITGTFKAEYSYGKPVRGEVEIHAKRYVGKWEEFATITKNIDGDLSFNLPAVGYVSGVPAAGGQGNVMLEVTVREKATGYEEKTTRLLTVAQSKVTLKLIPEGIAFKPNLPFNVMVAAESPDKKPQDARVQVSVNYLKEGFKNTQETRQVEVKNGKGLLTLAPPADAIGLTLSANAGGAWTSLSLNAGYSPSGSFIRLEQVSTGPLKVGDRAKFRVQSTKQAANFYYEILSRGKVMFSDVSKGPDIEFTLQPLMAPGARLLVYQITPNSEVAADYLPFSVEGDYPQSVTVGFSKPEAKPGEQLDINVQTEGPARVGLAAVDRSVFILAENRLNLQQVFAELERLYQTPQAEIHDVRSLNGPTTLGANEVFRSAGVVILSNQTVPQGKTFENPRLLRGAFGGEEGAGGFPDAMPMMAGQKTAAEAQDSTTADRQSGLAEVQRVRQFFPETWLWADLTTDSNGRATKRVETPDSITTWMLRAVALSKDKGLGISEAQLRVIQPFFAQIDLPYAAIRGEQFPVKVAIYNYTAIQQDFVVDLERSPWFDIIGETGKTVSVGPNDVGGLEFTIRPRELGTQKVKITARSQQVADALVKEIMIDPEGVQREQVDNLIIQSGSPKELDTTTSPTAISGSSRVYLGVTGSYLTQSIEGLDKLIQMPYGCGEQNMILLAPDIYIAQYLKETGQMKPEIMAKLETMMVTGYQRELTYRHGDGSFSAFGKQDKEGSLWLTAFVLKTFAQAKGQMYVDDTVLNQAKIWIARHQNRFGSFDNVGFVTHQELMGGVKGITPLTAYITIALLEAGEKDASTRAIGYLEDNVEKSNDPYTVAIVAYALELAKSPKAAVAYERLMGLAKEGEAGLYWGDDNQVQPLSSEETGLNRLAQPKPGPSLRPNKTASIETTGYAMLALIEHGDKINTGKAARWLVSQRNAYGGYGSTQDTVVALQALTKSAASAKGEVDMTITLKSGQWKKEVKVSPDNVDVLQIIDLPTGEKITAEAVGKGQVVMQLVRRYNLPDAERKEQSAFKIDVTYGTDQVAVNDLITVNVNTRFTPPEPVQAGMVVVDVAIPTGFAPVTDSIDKMVKGRPKIKRYDVAGRKVIFYIEDLNPQEQIAFAFQARALYPVRAQAVASQAYSYYRPEFKGESLGGAMVVN